MSFVIRELKPRDEKVLDDYLRPHTAEAYFLRSNALAAGLIYHGKPCEANYFGAFEDGEMVGVIAYSWMNTLLFYADSPLVMKQLAQEFVPVIKQRSVQIEAVLGLPDLAASVVDALQIPKNKLRKNDKDELFLLNKHDLKPPSVLNDPSVHLRLAEEKDAALLIAWRVAFNVEANDADPGDETKRKAETEMTRRIQSRDLFVLEKDNVPVAMVGCAGDVPNVIMVGPVWTLPEWRGRGYAKAVTAGILRMRFEERSKLEQAVLCAVRPDAIRAYQSIGFRKINDWKLIFLKDGFRL